MKGGQNPVKLTAEAVEKGNSPILSFLIFVFIDPPKNTYNRL